VPVKEDQAYPFISVLSDDESFGEGQQSNVFELLITLSICVKEDNAHTGGRGSVIVAILQEEPCETHGGFSRWVT
jgi:hypothetical protein